MTSFNQNYFSEDRRHFRQKKFKKKKRGKRKLTFLLIGFYIFFFRKQEDANVCLLLNKCVTLLHMSVEYLCTDSCLVLDYKTHLGLIKILYCAFLFRKHLMKRTTYLLRSSPPSGRRTTFLPSHAACASAGSAATSAPLSAASLALYFRSTLAGSSASSS